MAGILNRDKQKLIIKCLVDGNSIRSSERITGVHRYTIMRLMVRVVEGCAAVMDQELPGPNCRTTQLDKIWCFIYRKHPHLQKEDDITPIGDIWTWGAIDSDIKLIPPYAVGKRYEAMAKVFVTDLADRVTNRRQTSTDGLSAYAEAVWRAISGEVDYATVVKSYEAELMGPGRCSPPKVSGLEKKVILGVPNMKEVFRSYVEIQNLTMQMCMRRPTRLTNGFSKKVENHKAATAQHFANYNFCRLHRTVTETPAMAAGVTFQHWSVRDLLVAATEVNV